MQHAVMKTLLETLKKKVWLNRIAIVSAAFSTCVMTGQLMTNDTTVTAIPWTLQYTSRITENSADTSYQIAWGLALAMMFGNCNYGVVDTIEPRIRPLLPKKSTEATIRALRRQAEQFKESRITVRYEIESYTAEDGKVFVEGSYYIKAPGVAERRHLRTYEFEIRMKDYQPVIQYMTTYEDHAHTKAYLKEMEKLRKQAEQEERASVAN